MSKISMLIHKLAKSEIEAQVRRKVYREVFELGRTIESSYTLEAHSLIISQYETLVGIVLGEWGVHGAPDPAIEMVSNLIAMLRMVIEDYEMWIQDPVGDGYE